MCNTPPPFSRATSPSLIVCLYLGSKLLKLMAASNAGGVRKKRDSQWISSRLVLDYHVWSPFEWSSIVYSMWADDHLVLKTRCTDTWTGRAMARIISTISTITGSYLWHKLMMICRRQIVQKIIFYPPFGDPWRYRHQKWRNPHLRWSSNVTQNFTTISRRYLSPGKKKYFLYRRLPWGLLSHAKHFFIKFLLSRYHAPFDM